MKLDRGRRGSNHWEINMLVNILHDKKFYENAEEIWMICIEFTEIWTVMRRGRGEITAINQITENLEKCGKNFRSPFYT